MCEIFLASGFSKSGIEGRDFMIFSDGQPLEMSFEQSRVLYSSEDLLLALNDSNFPWIDDLRSPHFNIPPGYLAYVSPLGVSLWENKEFESWVALQNLINWNSPAEVQEVLAHLMADEWLPGVSPQMQIRLHNSLSAHMDALDRSEDVAFKYSQFLFSDDLKGTNPLPGIPQTFYAMSSKDQKRFLPLLASLAKVRAYEETVELLRNHLPSFNITFNEDGAVENYLDAIWIGRMILREPLVRRLWNANVWATDVPDVMQEETVALLSAFPEFTPFWPLVQNWQIYFRHYRLHLKNGFYQMPVGPLNPEGDSLILDLRHKFTMVQGSRTETSYIKLQFKGERDRLVPQLEKDWAQFQKVVGMSGPAPALDLIEQDEEPYLALKPKRRFSRSHLLAFYFYLSYKYPSQTSR